MELTTKQKAAFGIGAVGKDMVYALSASYVMYYYQDVLGLSATFVGLRLMMTVLPMVVLVAALVLFRRKFTLSDDHAAEISAQLHGKKRVSDMTELHWRAATDAGSYDGTALISVGQGAVHLRTDLPAGTLENAVATLSWPMAENEKSS